MDESDTDEQKFLFPKSKTCYWVGLKRYTNEGWRWLDGTSLANSAWVQGNGSCVYASLQRKVTLKTKSCTHLYQYICEKQLA
ncbi:C-type lectin domain family 2 member F-like [Hemicordylus capensis]|uniref:C-type lectin domain family 2 member F-like n=1 Tax=Hemicordylus capensis TaxID=884348 RepID=UPI002304AE93|nr:C-type lectin domain family 2 member F-like [Hemicordylus capensis]